MAVGERVQLDRLTPSPHGSLAVRRGRLLDPGTTTLALAPGHHVFRTLSDAHLRVVTGGVTAGIATGSVKDPTPPGSVPTPDDDSSLPDPSTRGDDAAGEPPHVTIEHA
jgi:hypothetical protein